jgi:hypothetical protein
MLFFHAASVAVGDAGALFVGAKGSGKTTLSMALAARGAVFLGDEIAGVRPQTWELLPVRRAVSVRPGPKSLQVEELLRRRDYPLEKLPDGSVRLRAEAGQLFPVAGERAYPLRLIFFLRQFEDRPCAEQFQPGSVDMRLLTPLPCSLWGGPPSRRIMQVAGLLSKIKCHYLYPGQADETAALVERIARN